MPQKVLALMSGGVDSSIAAASLVRQGFDVVGVTMKIWEEPACADDTGGRCRLCADIEDARHVCSRLNIPHIVFDAQSVFRKKVIEPFCEEYLGGRTPNPCVICNVEIKFGLMLRRARELGAVFVATGHYARIKHDETRGRFLLLKGRDPAKDQSYFLYRITHDQLKHILFPLGSLTKPEVRWQARALGLHVSDKTESQEICFVPAGDYRGLLERMHPGSLTPGPIMDVNGKHLGTHRGIACYTIGQRRGLGIAHSRPLYVVGFDRKKNAVVVGTSEHLWSRELLATRVNWISAAEPAEPFRAHARIRYKHRESPATVVPLEGQAARVRFDKPQRAVTPGQSVVLYDGNLVAGGGIIESAATEASVLD
jgi:tRNA-specific 2-thiouridylase